MKCERCGTRFSGTLNLLSQDMTEIIDLSQDLIKPDLCSDCSLVYNALVKKFNQEIIAFLR